MSPIGLWVVHTNLISVDLIEGRLLDASIHVMLAKKRDLKVISIFQMFHTSVILICSCDV
jgi:hypothetical protein